MKSPFQYFAVCDVETGGLISKTKQAVYDVALTEVAIVIVDANSLEIVDKDSWLIQPYDDNVEYNPQAAAVSGISKQMCEADGYPINDVCNKICGFLKQYKVGRNLPTMVGHNFRGFDQFFIANLFEYCQVDMSKVLNCSSENIKALEELSGICKNCKDEEIVGSIISAVDKMNKLAMFDTIEFARLLWPEAPNYKLGTCCNQVGVDLVEAHRALPDTIATAKFFIKMLKNLRGMGGARSSEKEEKRFRKGFQI